MSYLLGHEPAVPDSCTVISGELISVNARKKPFGATPLGPPSRMGLECAAGANLDD